MGQYCLELSLSSWHCECKDPFGSQLMVDFFGCAKACLEPATGGVYITTLTRQQSQAQAAGLFQSNWNLEQMAVKAGLELVDVYPFLPTSYPRTMYSIQFFSLRVE